MCSEDLRALMSPSFTFERVHARRREDMDANAIQTFERARAAHQAGHTEHEVIAVEVPSGKRGGGTGAAAGLGPLFCHCFAKHTCTRGLRMPVATRSHSPSYCCPELRLHTGNVHDHSAQRTLYTTHSDCIFR